MRMEYLAHVKQEENGVWEIHHLEDHLREVGSLASEMASGFSSENWAKLAGLWHDLGKYRTAFQGYIKWESGCDLEVHIKQERVDHSTMGDSDH